MPRVFLSSAHNENTSGVLEYFKIRRSIREIGNEEDIPIWIAEEAAKQQPELIPGTENWVGPIKGCVEELHKSDLLIVILASRPGTAYELPTIGNTAASVLEIELFLASYCEIPTVFYCVRGCEPEPELNNLIRILQLKDNRNWHVLEEKDILVHIRSLLKELKKENNISEWRLRYVPDRLAQLRMRSSANEEASSSELTMIGRFSPIVKKEFNEHAFHALFNQACAFKTENRFVQLSFLWMAMRELSTGTCDAADRLRLWQDLINEWGGASAWLGLHGYMNAGTISALHTQVHLRQRGVEQVTPYGGFASALYSVGKRLQTTAQKGRVFQRSIELATIQMQENPNDVCGCLSIRASAKMQMALLNRPWLALAGLADYSQAYKQSQKLRRGDPAIGFALVELACAQFKLASRVHWRWAEALRRMHDGISMMEENASTESVGSIVRVRRMYAECLYCAKRRDEASDVLRKAREIASTYGLADQVRQLDEMEANWEK